MTVYHGVEHRERCGYCNFTTPWGVDGSVPVIENHVKKEHPGKEWFGHYYMEESRPASESFSVPTWTWVIFIITVLIILFH
jgi:hypothetical protein